MNSELIPEFLNSPKNYPQKIPGAKRPDGTSLYRPINFEHKVVRCTNPQTAWFNPATNKMMFKGSGLTEGWKPIKMNCRSCVWCRLQATREWAVRCTHEAKFHDKKCFLTLTYNDEHLPHVGGQPTLLKSDLQKFLKRLRAHLEKYRGVKIRYFACGEYGEKLSRPHYHLIVYGYDFPDKTVFRAGRNKNLNLYRSTELERLWPFGHSSVGNFSYESASYVASYCVKKINGKDKEKHYNERQQEFVCMSKGRAYVDKTTGEYVQSKGIGYDFFKNYTDDLYNSDSCRLSNGTTCSVPRYYDKCLRVSDPVRYDAIKSARVLKAESELSGKVYEVGTLETVENSRQIINKSRKRSYECLSNPKPPSFNASSLFVTQQLARILQQESLSTTGKPSRGLPTTASLLNDSVSMSTKLDTLSKKTDS